MEKQAGKQLRDLTDFFLEWYDTCAIDECKRADDVRYVHAMFDKELKSYIRLPRRSSLGKGVVALSNITIDFERTHAFHLVELYFYGQDKIKGKPFKQHLFGSETTKNGAGRLNGYFIQTLQSVAKDSFKKSVAGSSFIRDNSGKEMSPLDFVSTASQPTNADGVSTDDPLQKMATDECVREFRSRFAEMWKALRTDERLALLCDVFNLSRNNPEIVAASGLKQAAFYNRHPLQKVRGIVDDMLADYAKDELVNVCRNYIYVFAYELGKTDSNCFAAVTQIEREGQVSGTVG